MWGNFMFIGPI